MFTTDLTTPFTTAELQAIQSILQNETAWDRDADTGGFNSVYSAANPERIMLPVHEEEKWKLLNTAMLRIDVELERRKQRQEKFDRLFPTTSELPTQNDALADRGKMVMPKPGAPAGGYGGAE